MCRSRSTAGARGVARPLWGATWPTSCKTTTRSRFAPAPPNQPSRPARHAASLAPDANPGSQRALRQTIIRQIADKISSTCCDSACILRVSRGATRSARAKRAPRTGARTGRTRAARQHAPAHSRSACTARMGGQVNNSGLSDPKSAALECYTQQGGTWTGMGAMTCSLVRCRAPACKAAFRPLRRPALARARSSLQSRVVPRSSHPVPPGWCPVAGCSPPRAPAQRRAAWMSKQQLWAPSRHS